LSLVSQISQRMGSASLADPLASSWSVACSMAAGLAVSGGGSFESLLSWRFTPTGDRGQQHVLPMPSPMRLPLFSPLLTGARVAAVAAVAGIATA
jgi:hypothetical protein